VLLLRVAVVAVVLVVVRRRRRGVGRRSASLAEKKGGRGRWRVGVAESMDGSLVVFVWLLLFLFLTAGFFFLWTYRLIPHFRSSEADFCVAFCVCILGIAFVPSVFLSYWQRCLAVYFGHVKEARKLILEKKQFLHLAYLVFSGYLF
jgi:hypothetical protein